MCVCSTMKCCNVDIMVCVSTHAVSVLRHCAVQLSYSLDFNHIGKLNAEVDNTPA